MSEEGFKGGLEPGEPVADLWEGQETPRRRERTITRKAVQTTKHPYVALVTALVTAVGGGAAYFDSRSEKRIDDKAAIVQEVEQRLRDEYWRESSEDMHADLFAALELQAAELVGLRRAIRELSLGDRREARRLVSDEVRPNSSPLPPRPSHRPEQTIKGDELTRRALKYEDELNDLKQRIRDDGK